MSTIDEMKDRAKDAAAKLSSKADKALARDGEINGVAGKLEDAVDRVTDVVTDKVSRFTTNGRDGAGDRTGVARRVQSLLARNGSGGHGLSHAAPRARRRVPRLASWLVLILFPIGGLLGLLAYRARRS